MNCRNIYEMWKSILLVCIFYNVVRENPLYENVSKLIFIVNDIPSGTFIATVSMQVISVLLMLIICCREMINQFVQIVANCF